MSCAQNIAIKISNLNKLLAVGGLKDEHPVGLINGMSIEQIVDRSGQIGDHQRYQRYSYQHGLKFHVTIVKSDATIARPPYVMSLLFDDGGWIVNPMCLTLSHQDQVDYYNFTIAFLDALITEVSNGQGISDNHAGWT